jgi:hypothetical protein
MPVRIVEGRDITLETGDYAQENSSFAREANLEIFLMHRPQQFFLSFSSKEEISFFGQVTPALPNS